MIIYKINIYILKTVEDISAYDKKKNTGSKYTNMLIILISSLCGIIDLFFLVLICILRY